MRNGSQFDPLHLERLELHQAPRDIVAEPSNAPVARPEGLFLCKRDGGTNCPPQRGRVATFRAPISAISVGNHPEMTTRRVGECSFGGCARAEPRKSRDFRLARALLTTAWNKQAESDCNIIGILQFVRIDDALHIDAVSLGN